MNKILLCLCLLIPLSGCAVDNSSETKQAAELPQLSCVAVLPTVVPVSASKKLSTDNRKALDEGASYIDSQLLIGIGAKPTFKMLADNRVDALLNNPWGGRIEQLQTIGKATGCGAILETSISRYQQRVGNEMSAEIPAAAAFSMELIAVQSGTVIWSTSYDETQQALFDNILSFSTAERRGFKWLSVEELINDALERRMAEFPYFQEDDI